MTCRSLRDSIRDDHDLWRRLYYAWERHVGVVRIPDFHLRYSRRPLLPKRGQVLREIEDKPLFNGFVRKLVALTFGSRCGICGQTRRGTVPVWALNARVCSNCWRGNLISNQALYHKYGVTLTEPLPGEEGETFIEKCFETVLFFGTYMNATQRQYYTHNPLDFNGRRTERVVFFWRPHLDRVADLDALYLSRRRKEQAGALLLALLKRRQVQLTIVNTFKKGLVDGFGGMNKAEKEAVLSNIQLKETFARPGAALERPVFLFEKLYSQARGALLARASSHMARLPERYSQDWLHVDSE